MLPALSVHFLRGIPYLVLSKVGHVYHAMSFHNHGRMYPIKNGKIPKDHASPPTVHAIGVCDNPDYFYQTMASIANEMGMTFPNNDCDMTNEEFIRKAVTVHNGKGKGYAFSSQEELDFIVQFATETGIALDPVYSGKALYYFLNKVVEENPELYRNKNILFWFWHTGGAIGLYEKGDDLLERLRVTSPVKRIDVYGKMEGSGDDVVPIC